MSASLIEAGNNLAAAVRNGSVGIVSAALAAWYEAAGSAEDITSGTEGNPIGESGGVLMVGLDDNLDEQPEGDVFATSAASDLAEREGVELEDVEGSGQDGRILVSDVEAAAVVEAAEARAEAEARVEEDA